MLLAMDCCYGGRLVSSRSASSEYEERLMTRRAHVIISSGRGDQQVSDGVPGENSPFATAFIKALDSNGPARAITSSQIYSSMETYWMQEDFNQEPLIGYPEGAQGGNFVFVLR